MKASTTLLTILSSASITIAAPTTSDGKFVTTRDTMNSGYLVPTVLKVHDINSNMNRPDYRTTTVRNRNAPETSTLYDIPVPASLAGKTCGITFRAGGIAAGSDYLDGTKTMDIFKGDFSDLNTLLWGNLRGQELGRIKFDASNPNSVYTLNKQDVPTKLDSFPCPAGQTIHWEAVAQGEVSVNVVKQDFYYDGTSVPNGMSVHYW